VSDKSVEEQLGELLNDAADAAELTGEHAARGNRILQLARREGFVKGTRWQYKHLEWLQNHPEPNVETHNHWALADAEDAARDTFPIIRTMEVPRIEPDPHDFGEYRIALDSSERGPVIEHRRHNRADFDGEVPPPTRERVTLWLDMLEHPTKTETVEE